MEGAMGKMIGAIACTLLMLAGTAAVAAPADVKGNADHPLVTRIPEFRIGNFQDKDFDRYEFLVQDGKKVSKVPVEGHFYFYLYELNQGAAQPGDLKIVRNIQNALAKIGGKVLYEGDGPKASTIKVARDGKETWVYVVAWPTVYRLTVVEREAMEQVVEANAEAMGNDIKATGHVAVYGIYFDSGKADIKPESDTVIAELAKLLKSNASLKLHVVGHTDNTGAFDGNMKLSKDRAAAVAKALEANHGIATSRLNAYGVGSLCPVATNRTDEGKAKNRRVELVEQ
jgi:outer membrane protein OmpA-like peptidoglycan-associated protein